MMRMKEKRCEVIKSSRLQEFEDVSYLGQYSTSPNFFQLNMHIISVGIKFIHKRYLIFFFLFLINQKEGKLFQHVLPNFFGKVACPYYFFSLQKLKIQLDKILSLSGKSILI